MSSVKSTIDASQSAHIRSSFAGTATVVTAALKWKRKIKKGNAATDEPKSLASVMTGKEDKKN